MAVNYDAGRGNMGQLYTNLQNALANRGDAENRREARDIERKGLFGTGIRQSDIQDFGNLAIRGAQLGDARMGQKMDRATKSFDRRMAADERRLATLQKRADLGDANALTEIKGIQYGMNERRNSFEDYMGKYQEKGLWGTSFGGDEVGYRTEGESKYSQAVKQKLDSGGDSGEFTTSNFGGERTMGIGDNKFNTPEGGGESNEYEENFGEVDQGPSGEYLDKWGRSGRYASTFPGREGFLGTNLGKKKDNLGDSVMPISGPVESSKFNPNPELGLGESRISRSGKNPARLPMSGALRDLTPLQRRRGDVLEKRELIADQKQALGQNESEQKQMIEEMLAKRRNNLITEALRKTD